MNLASKNSNGLTLAQWLRAAGWRSLMPHVLVGNEDLLELAERAFSNNEDPTDYRADGTFAGVK